PPLILLKPLNQLLRRLLPTLSNLEPIERRRILALSLLLCPLCLQQLRLRGFPRPCPAHHHRKAVVVDHVCACAEGFGGSGLGLIKGCEVGVDGGTEEGFVWVGVQKAVFVS